MDLAALTIPSSVLDGARYVTAAAHDVVIPKGRLADIAGKIQARLAAGIDDVDVAFGSAGTVERDVNLILFETACNFCFWSEREEKAWQVDVDGTAVGGWYGLAACFNSSARSGVPVWDAEWMAKSHRGTSPAAICGSQRFNTIDRACGSIISSRAANYLLRKHHGQALDLLRLATSRHPGSPPPWCGNCRASAMAPGTGADGSGS